MNELVSKAGPVKHEVLAHPDGVSERLCIVDDSGPNEPHLGCSVAHLRVMDRERNDIDKDKPHLLRVLDPKLNGEFELFRRKRRVT